MAKKEAVFSKQVRDDILALCHNSHVYLIQDSYRTGRKPYDFYVVYGRRFYAVECKSLAGQSMNLSCVTDRQVQSLTLAYKAGSCSRSLIMVQSEYHKKVYVFTITAWKGLLAVHGNQKSIKFDRLEEEGYVSVSPLRRIKKCGKTRWEVDELFTP